MFGIGMPELAVIIVVALVVLGPKRLPEVARSLGKGLAEFRRLTGDVNKELDAARHMIESEAREHENERRRADREARSTPPEIEPTDDTKAPAPDTEPTVVHADQSRQVESPASAKTGSTSGNPPSTPAAKETEG
jgi:sec-independent protein translocase protein TatB